MSWELVIRDKAKKKLKRFPKEEAARIVRALGELILNPYGGDVEKLEGEEGAWRRRVGNYRIFYEIRERDSIIYVYRIERRTSSTY